MPKFLLDNGTQAKVLGRMDAYKVLAHLQEEAVAENYAMLEGEEIPKGRRKQSVIGQEVVKAI